MTRSPRTVAVSLSWHGTMAHATLTSLRSSAFQLWGSARLQVGRDSPGLIALDGTCYALHR